MIKAENLRIGDIVRVCYDCEFPEGAVCVVSEMGTLKVCILRKGSTCMTWYSDIEGIPLTPEILEKNGWNSDVLIPALYTNKTHQLEVECHSYSKWRYVTFNGMAVNRVKYVHELQHILWVLGMDSNIKI